MNIVALIPARAGSRRIPGKNIKLLGGKPLIQWTIEAAQASGIFSNILVPTDDKQTTDLAYALGARAAYRPHSSDTEPDIVWVSTVLTNDVDATAFAILRPTSPFRDGCTIRNAWLAFQLLQPADSLRSVRPATEHPGKMWMCQRNQRIVPLLPYWTRTGSDATDSPWHSTPTQCLPVIHIQTAGLEIAWTKTVTDTGSISGTNIIPFTLMGSEALDINTPEDWDRAERHMADLQTAAPAQL